VLTVLSTGKCSSEGGLEKTEKTETCSQKKGAVGCILWLCFDGIKPF
jgi:hypothetical protein